MYIRHVDELHGTIDRVNFIKSIINLGTFFSRQLNPIVPTMVLNFLFKQMQTWFYNHDILLHYPIISHENNQVDSSNGTIVTISTPNSKDGYNDSFPFIPLHLISQLC